MAYQPTTNFGWAMPRGGDQAQISVINQQFTAKADEIVYQTRRMIAPGYIDDGSKTYQPGEIVEYENVDYVCTGTTSGAWDSSKWDSTDVATQIQEAKESGGTNVEANPVEAATADLHKLKVDTTVYGIPDPTVTKTATGNPIEFSDGADAPLVKCVTEIQGSQDLHGYDKPWVGGAGKNMLNLDGNVYSYSGNTPIGIGSADVVSGQTYTLSCYQDKAFTSNTRNTLMIQFDGETYYEDTSDNYHLQTGRHSMEFVPASSGTANFYIWCHSPSDSSITYSKIMFQKGTLTDYEPYFNICPITAYTEGEIEVRGKNLLYGKVDNSNIVNNGTIVTSSETDFDIHYAKVKQGSTYTITDGSASSVYGFFSTVPTTGTQSYNQSRAVEENHTFTAPITGYVGVRTAHNYATPQLEEGETATPYSPYTSTTHTTTYPSAIYRGSEDCVKGTATTEWGMIASYAGETLPGEWISDRDEYAPGTTPTTGAQVAYELATPTTSSVTPTNLPIKSLSGYSHIESSTGEMEVEYITEPYEPLLPCHIYATTEQVVGKWVDGKDVYEKTYTITPSGVPADWVGFDTISIGKVISVDGYTKANAGGQDAYSSIHDAIFGCRIQYNPVIGRGQLCYYFANSDVTEIGVTVQYTKATAVTRSLSKGTTDSLKADLSEEKKEIEELTTTDEKAVKKAQSEGEEVTEKVTEKTKEEADETEGNADEGKTENEEK